jgi:hypothetical protein
LFLALIQSNGTEVLPLNDLTILTWFQANASAVYKNYMNTFACPINASLPAYNFCVQDTILSQSALLGQLTVKSESAYQLANSVLGNKTYFI